MFEVNGVYRYRNETIWHSCILITDEYIYLKELTGIYDKISSYTNDSDSFDGFVKVGQR